jgi:hypothetical protein
MSHHKQPERRTFLQDRLEILIKRQRSGTASFNELTELDYIVNSDPEIRKKIIMENMLMDDIIDFTEPSDPLEKEEIVPPPHQKHTSLLQRVKAILANLFNFKFSILKSDGLSIVGPILLL